MIRAATYSAGRAAPVPATWSAIPRARLVGGRLSARLVLAGLLATVAFALASSPAAAHGCPSTDADDSYMSNCGPLFEEAACAVSPIGSRRSAVT